MRANDFDGYLNWLDNLFKANVPYTVSREPIDREYLNQTLTSHPLSLEKEILWVASRLRMAAPSINIYLCHLREIENSYINDRPRKVLRSILMLDKELGPSLWSLNLNIAIRAQFQGLEKQKRYAERIKSQSKIGLLSYFAHYVSVRNENNSSYSRFCVEMRDRIEKSNVSRGFKEYLFYKISSSLPEEERYLSDILRFEQSTSDIDLYETFISVVQSLIASGHGGTTHLPIKSCLEKISSIDDWRIRKCLIQIGADGGQTEVIADDGKIPDLLFKGNPVAAYSIALKRICQNRFDTIATIGASYSLSLRTKHQAETPVSSPLFVANKIASIIDKRAGFDRDASELEKLCKNLSAFCYFSAVFSFVQVQRNPFSHSWTKFYKLLALNTPTVSAFDILTMPETHRAQLSKPEAGLASRTIEAALTNALPPQDVDPSIRDYLCGLLLTEEGRYQEAVTALHGIASAHENALSLPAIAASLIALVRAGDRKGAIDLTARLAATLPEIRDILPIENVLGSNSWEDLEPFASSISLAILLDLRWRTHGTSDSATNRRFAFEEFLLRNDIDRPSHLVDRVNEFGQPQVVYFLRNVCVQSVMDMSDAFDSSRELDEERIAICSILRDLDIANIQDYHDEIFAITQILEIQDGLNLVNKSRLHVDTEAIEQWAISELTEPYLRYRDLVKAGIGSTDDFTSLLKLLFKPSAQETLDYFTVPENQADSILLTMIVSLRDKFLFDPTHGLDSYLSKRVRHGSILNFLRSPVEKAGLITQRDATRSHYKENEVWLPQLNDLAASDRKEVAQHFDEFAKSFDAIALNLKDKILHIKGNDHTDGAIELPITAPVFHIVRVGLQTDMAFDSFLKSSFVAFWSVLELSLKNLRNHLLVVTKNEIAEVFQRLRAGLSTVAAASPVFPKLSMEIGNVSAEVQAQVEAMSDWFKRSGSFEAGHHYSLEHAFRIAVASALNTLRAFTPHIARTIDDSVSVSAQSMVVLSEFMWVIFENVQKHSGIKDPHVRIDAVVDRQNETLSFTVVNSVSPKVHTPEAEQKLANIRAAISDGSYGEHVRREVNSGFKKIASVVSQSEKGLIDFGFVNDAEFSVTITTSFVLHDPDSDRGIKP